MSGSIYAMALFKSTNAGENWSSYFITTASAGNGIAIALDPNNDNIIYVGGTLGSGNKLFKSTDGGMSWAGIGSGVLTSLVNDIVVDPSSPNIVYAGTSAGFYKSENAGLAWTKTSPHSVLQIKVNRLSPNEVCFCGANGVYYSNNRGNTWTASNDGLEITNVNSLEWDAANKILYAGTKGRGVWKSGQTDLNFLTISVTSGGTTTPAPGTYGYAPGTVVTVTARPDTHCIFTGWSGDASGTANPITVKMNSSKSITASFLRIIYAPSNFSGVKKVNRSLFLSQYVNVLTWGSNPNNVDITKYRLYLQDGAKSLLAEVDANTLEYRHANVEKDKEYNYLLVAVNSAGREGEPATVKVK